MDTLLALTLAFLAGALLGLGFVFALRQSVRSLAEARHPALNAAAGMLLRFAAVLGTFYLVIEFGGWQHALAALAGFTLARLLLVRHLSATP